jgi:hypothetical protein
MLAIVAAGVWLGWKVNNARERHDAVATVQKWRVGALRLQIRKRQTEIRAKPEGATISSPPAKWSCVILGRAHFDREGLLL